MKAIIAKQLLDRSRYAYVILRICPSIKYATKILCEWYCDYDRLSSLLSNGDIVHLGITPRTVKQCNISFSDPKYYDYTQPYKEVFDLDDNDIPNGYDIKMCNSIQDIISKHGLQYNFIYCIDNGNYYQWYLYDIRNSKKILLKELYDEYFHKEKELRLQKETYI